MEYIIGLITLLGGGLFFYRTKAKSSGALNDNIETKNQIVKENQAIAENVGKIGSLTQDVKFIQESKNKELETPQSQDDLVRFLNEFSKRNKK